MASDKTAVVADHHMRNDLVSSRPKKVLIVVANPTTSATLGWPVGFWGAELTHPNYELTQRGIGVTIASPDGGRVELDSLSDPRDDSKWSADDLITMGFLNTPELAALLDNTPKLAELDLAEYDAIMVAGGQAPMFTFRDNEAVHDATCAASMSPRSRPVSTVTGPPRWSTYSSPTAPTSSTARPSPDSPTSRKTSATGS